MSPRRFDAGAGNPRIDVGLADARDPFVGMNEDDCHKKGVPFAVGRAFYRDNARGEIIGDLKGLIKLVFDPESLNLLGVHIVGESASEMLHIGMMVMQFGGTINAFIDCVFNFPTLSEAYKYAAYDGLGARMRM